MAVETIALWMIIAFTVVIGVKVITGNLLNKQAKALASLYERLRDLRVELGHAVEQKWSQDSTISYQERRKTELQQSIEAARQELADGDPGSDDGERRESADPKLPLYMRPRGEDVFE